MPSVITMMVVLPHSFGVHLSSEMRNQSTSSVLLSPNHKHFPCQTSTQSLIRTNVKDKICALFGERYG